MGKPRKPRDIHGRSGYAVFDPVKLNAPYDAPWNIDMRITDSEGARKLAAWLLKAADWLEARDRDEG